MFPYYPLYFNKCTAYYYLGTDTEVGIFMGTEFYSEIEKGKAKPFLVN
ncbi:hypothetical protein ACFP3I_20700 [Chryseobacterium arachidis]